MTDSELVAILEPLDPFKKVHYSVHYLNVPGLLTPQRRPLLEQLVRLFRSFPISTTFPQDVQFALAAELCPKYKANINLDCSPWQNMQAVQPKLKADSWGTEFVKDMMALTTNLTKVKAALGSLVPTVANIDHELWNNHDENPVSLDAKTNLLLSIFKEVFPTTDAILYDRGGINYANTDSGWSDNEYGVTTLNEPGDYYCCNLYNLNEEYMMEEVMRRNIAKAKERGIKRVIPWICLGGCGLLDKLSRIQWNDSSYDRTYPYDNSYRIGAAMNSPWCGQRPERFFDNMMIPYVLFWPTPLTCKAGPEHLGYYARGANLK